MTFDQDHPDPPEQTSAAGRAGLDQLLGDPRVWADPPPGLEESVLAAIAQEVDLVDMPDGPDTIVAMVPRRRYRLAQAVAAIAAVVAAIAVVTPSGTGAPPAIAPDAVVLLEGTDRASDASADVEVVSLDNGIRIVLDIEGLAPAPAGAYYEGWVRQSADVGVSAGTFHMRGGDGRVVLWAGVSTDDYPLLTVTLQQEGGGEATSGDVVLRGRVTR